MSDFETSRVASVLAELLMGAAYADDHLDGSEELVVRAKLREWLEVDELPEDLDEKLKAFKPETFELSASATLLGLDDEALIRRVLELVAAVHDANDELDLAEDEYLRSLARALGVDEKSYSDLKLEIVSVENLRDGYRSLTAMPPPVPKS